jgi:hypothetical protein
MVPTPPRLVILTEEQEDTLIVTLESALLAEEIYQSISRDRPEARTHAGRYNLREHRNRHVSAEGQIPHRLPPFQ